MVVAEIWPRMRRSALAYRHERGGGKLRLAALQLDLCGIRQRFDAVLNLRCDPAYRSILPGESVRLGLILYFNAASSFCRAGNPCAAR